jgi:hypothetical protein
MDAKIRDALDMTRPTKKGFKNPKLKNLTRIGYNGKNATLDCFPGIKLYPDWTMDIYQLESHV